MTDSYPVRPTVNGAPRSIDVSSTETLLDALRWDLNLTGSKECCAEGECGACTVLLDGRAVNACLVLAVEADGMDITTIEGMETGARLSRLQDAFMETGAIQCGFCIPGMVMAAQALLDQNPRPDRDEAREGLSGNLCRCAGYERIIDAVLHCAGEAAAEGHGGVDDLAGATPQGQPA
ncbi:MAG: aerobic carbon-monoxide dehydrogenase small subunit [Frankiaceae bacterium]|jgi:carbon-monoxide dehydrogenase small subunit|nr:aerobic carbon-monoxide dehydrogenase small subunit [Frankiaceae bacterium]